MSKKLRTKEIIFAGTLLTYSIPKYVVTAEGEVLTSMNRRTMQKKALKAYLKGKRFYKYKGELYAVPIINKNKLVELKEKVDGEDNTEGTGTVADQISRSSSTGETQT